MEEAKVCHILFERTTLLLLRLFGKKLISVFALRKKKVFKKANSLKKFQGHGRLLGVKSDKDLLTLTSDIGFRLKSKICLKNRYERKKTFFGHILLKFENDPSLTC